MSGGGLAFLLRRSAVGRVRFLGRRLRTVKGALSTGAMLLCLALVGSSAILRLLHPESFPRSAFDPAGVRLYGPAAILALTLVSLSAGRGLYFTPQEVDFLFPAPLGRRALLLYNVLSRLGMQVLSALWSSVFMLAYVPRPVNAVPAVLLIFVFMYVTAQLIAVASVAAEAWLPRVARRGLLAALAVAAVLGGVAVARGLPPGAGAGEIARAIARSPALWAASLPARPFAETFAAADDAHLALWSAASLAVIAAEIGLMMMLDVAWTERSLAVGRRIEARRRRVGGGGSGEWEGTAPRTKTRRVAVPELRFLGAGGALARRQLLELWRSPRSLVGVCVVAAIFVGITVGIPLAMGDRGSVPPEMARISLGFCLFFPLLATANLPFDFRRDVDRMAFLRSLPLAPLGVAVGEILPVVLAFVVLQVLIASLITFGTGSVPMRTYLGVLAVLVPVSWTSVAVDNLIFLLLPYRIPVRGQQDVQFMGKAMLVMMLKVLTLTIFALAAGAAAFAAMWLTDESWTVGVATAAVVVTLLCVPLTWLVARAFTAFDVARDVPG
ncbi:MAG TPA: putative ABC exporter domain-containing protein [Longimicrobiaceae bacterium]|nr:putative ABC exporter domain-containing protein [Longimicrobiaceae bacterium]